jgi:hypothetical protein
MNYQEKTFFIRLAYLCGACILVVGAYLYGKSQEAHDRFERERVEATTPLVRETDPDVARQVEDARIRQNFAEATVVVKKMMDAADQLLQTAQKENDILSRRLEIWRLLRPSPCAKLDLRQPPHA